MRFTRMTPSSSPKVEQTAPMQTRKRKIESPAVVNQAGPRAKKRIVQDIVDAPTRVLRSSRVELTSLTLESILKLTRGAASRKTDSGIANLGMTCYVAAAVQVAFSVSSWREVLLLIHILFLFKYV